MLRHTSLYIVFIVGTHKDKLGRSADKKIAKMNEHLDSLINSSSCYQDLVQYADRDKGQVMFTVDNTSDSDQDFGLIRSRITTLVRNRSEFTIEYPFSYLLFSLELQHEQRSVLSLAECEDIAAKYGIVGDQVSHLLQFLHSRVGVIQYFDVDGLRHLVLAEPQVLFKRVTNLIIKTFSCEALTTKEQKEFQKGILTASVLQHVVGSELEITCQDFLTLLVHLHIITPYPFTTSGSQEEKYFIPCVLSHVQNATENDLSTDILPLTVQFQCEHCPKGLFILLVTYLMNPESDKERSEKHTSLKLSEGKIFRDQVSFEAHSTGVHDEVSVKVHPSLLEVKFFPELSEDRDTSIGEVCQRVREILDISITKSLKNLYYSEENVKPVMCLPCDHCSVPHAVEKGTEHYKIYCKKFRKTSRIPVLGRYWYNEGWLFKKKIDAFILYTHIQALTLPHLQIIQF